MVFDALDGRLERFTRHTTDFGGQLDSLADVVSFGAAPAFHAPPVFKSNGPPASVTAPTLLALQVFKVNGPTVSFIISRFIWAIGALYFSCAAIRLARFNVS